MQTVFQLTVTRGRAPNEPEVEKPRKIVILPSSKQTYIVKNLTPYTAYNVEICAFTVMGCGPKNIRIIFMPAATTGIFVLCGTKRFNLRHKFTNFRFSFLR